MRAALVIIALLAAAPAPAQEASPHDAHRAHLGASVMPFDLARSTHVFAPTSDGGTQWVVAKDGDPAQIALIQSHLRREAEAFAGGDFADPAAIHGPAMPGLAELQAGAARIRVTYEALPNGARLRFSTQDPALVEALNRWFVAQVHDHGADAVLQPR